MPLQPPYRKIIHIDMDAFYASIEQRDFPELKGKPIAVGGSPVGRGGVVATASYEARKFGVRSAMSSKTAASLCKDLVFIKPRFEVYKQVSQQIRAIFQRYTDLIEPLSLDEAYLDVTQDKLSIGSAIDIATEIKRSIREELRLTASAGVSINKFVAKIASDLNKPDGLTFIGPSKVEAFMEELPVEKFHGVGKVTADKMHAMGLHRGLDLKKLTEQELINRFGKAGGFFYKIVRGIDDRQVEPHRETKSVGAEDTFNKDLTDLIDVSVEIEKLAVAVFQRCQRAKVSGRTVTVKIKFHDFKIITRSESVQKPMENAGDINHLALKLLESALPDGFKIRLLGVSISNFGDSAQSRLSAEDQQQLRLF